MVNLTSLNDLNNLSCDYAFYFRQPGEMPVFKANCDRFSSASILKVPLLLAWMYLECNGDISDAEICNLDDEPQVQGAGFSWKMQTRQISFHDVLLMMIANSDNLCTNLVIRRIGLERIQSIFQDVFAFQGSTIQRKLMDMDARSRGLDNWINPLDCIEWYGMIQTLPEEQRQKVEGMLASCQDDALLMRNIPRDSVTFFHKTGSLDKVLHDWGFTRNCEIFLLTQGFQSEPPVFDFFGKIGASLIR